MIGYLQAQRIIRENAISFGVEEVALDEALGRVLAERVVANRDYPPFNRAAVDGFAIRYSDFERGLRSFQIIEAIFAGQENSQSISEGECYKIMTGAAVPIVADTVIRREDVVESGNSIKLNNANCSFFQNIALRGQDLKKDALALPSAFKLNASSIGLLASLSKHRVKVEKLPRVAIVTTGNEVVPVTEKANDFQINNSNVHVLKALLLESGIKNITHVHVVDNKGDLQRAVSAFLPYDLLILTGGVSAGDADYVPEILQNLGVIKLFHKVAIKPGKPIFCGQMASKRLVFALPGNPFSCLVTFKLFVETYLSACNGLGMKIMQKYPISFNRTKKMISMNFFQYK